MISVQRWICVIRETYRSYAIPTATVIMALASYSIVAARPLRGRISYANTCSVRNARKVEACSHLSFFRRSSIRSTINRRTPHSSEHSRRDAHFLLVQTLPPRYPKPIRIHPPLASTTTGSILPLYSHSLTRCNRPIPHRRLSSNNDRQHEDAFRVGVAWNHTGACVSRIRLFAALECN